MNTSWKGLDEIYKIYMLLHRSDLNISEKFRQTVSENNFPLLLSLPPNHPLGDIMDIISKRFFLMSGPQCHGLPLKRAQVKAGVLRLLASSAWLLVRIAARRIGQRAGFHPTPTR